MADVVVIGAGIAGISTAYQLTVNHGVSDVSIVDPRPPLTLTSDKSTECYRNWWPSGPMVALMNRSIDILESLATETDFGFNRRGYLYVTASDVTLQGLRQQVGHIADLGAEADVLNASDLIARYPFLSSRALGGIRLRRAGWFSAQGLGQWMLDRARSHGASLIDATVTSIGEGTVGLDDGTSISTSDVVIAAGPMSGSIASVTGIELPVFSELHLKVSFKDHLGVIPRDAPMTIWADPQRIEWSEEERAELERQGRQDLLGEMPVFCHFRPEGGPESPFVVALWEYHNQILEPSWPLPEDPLYPEVVMRGLTTMVPDLTAYRDRLPESFVDGGYYTKTEENRPLIGPTHVSGIHLMAGLSGFGVMVSPGAADLVARHIVGTAIPDYAPAFLLERYDDPSYLAEIEHAASGQL